MIEIEIKHRPIAKRRHRMSKKRAYDLQKLDKTHTAWLMKSKYRGQPLNFPLLVSFIFVYLPNQSLTAKKKKELFDTPKMTKPDLSNLTKFYEDVGNGILWKDDNLICGYLDSKKIYGKEEKVIIKIYSYDGENGNDSLSGAAKDAS